MIVEFPAPPGTRLRLALQALDRALGCQHAAATEWMEAAKRLRNSVGALRGDLDRYDGELTRVASGLGSLRGEARRLEAWAARASACT